MKKILCYFIILGLAAAIPQKRLDVGKLLPVELIYIDEKDAEIIIRTDTGDTGEGATLDKAFNNLEETAKGVIYLDTAIYLLVSEDGLPHMKELWKYVKKEIKVCRCNSEVDLKEAATYLSVHDPKITLKMTLSGKTKLPELKVEKSGMKLVK